MLVKKHDIIKPTYYLVEEKQRYLRMGQGDTTAYVVYFAINSIAGELDFPNSEIFCYQQQQFTFLIGTSVNAGIVASKKALSTVRNKKKKLGDLDSHVWEGDNETSTDVVGALESVNELEASLDQTKESMCKLDYVARVSTKNLDEPKQRCGEIKDFYGDLSIKLVRPFGDILGLHNEFVPSNERYINGHIQYVTSDFLAGPDFGTTQMLGENSGIYVGYDLDISKDIYFQPSLTSQGVRGSVTNASAPAFIGSLGGRKSFSNSMLVYYSIFFDEQAIIADPKVECGKWKETLPDITHKISIVNLMSGDDNRRLFDPYVILKPLKDPESLAIDILTFLTGTPGQDNKKFPVPRKATRSVTQSEQRGLLLIVDES